jgi:hypothetical protein
MALKAANIVIPTTSEPAGLSVTAMPQTLQDLHNHKHGHAGSSRKIIQHRLAVGTTDDPYEGEADAVADQVMRMPESGFMQRKCAHCESEEKINRKTLCGSITPFIQAKSEGDA